LPVVRRLLAHDHPEDRRLAGAVRADQADLLAPEDRRGRIDEQDLRAVLLADLIEPDHRPRSLLDQRAPRSRGRGGGRGRRRMAWSRRIGMMDTTTMGAIERHDHE